MKRSPFESASAAVQEWLYGPGSSWATRDTRVRVDEGLAYDIDLSSDSLHINAVRLVLPADFPASTCELYVDRAYFLKLPHVEADGHVCLGLASIPDDYDDPVSAVLRAVRALKDQLLGPAVDAQWVEAQFQAERVSYWAQHCIRRRREPDRRPVPPRTFVDVGELGVWAAARIAAYAPRNSKHRQYSLQVASSVDPNELATRHQWADGTMVRGNALFVRLASDAPWTPAIWPQSFDDLDALVGRATDHECSLVQWVHKMGWADDPAPRKRDKKARKHNAEAPPGQRPMLVVLVQEGTMFGYQLFGSTIPKLQPPAIEPVHVTRVDADWVLARDHNLDVLHARRKKRALLLGAGSLGSPLAKALGRAGLGHLDIVDAELMDPENTSRHELGLPEAGLGKARELARRLMKEVPGITVNGYLDDATTWTTKNCQSGRYDVVIECTAESSVRTFLSHMRTALFGNCPVIHAWTEPLCSAGHVVLTQPEVPWPEDDPADALVNASDLAAGDTRVALPACSAGFHPYGVADIELVAAFAAERVVAVLDDPKQTSAVWSWVRSSAFFDALPVDVSKRIIVPVCGSRSDAATTTRELSKVLHRG